MNFLKKLLLFIFFPAVIKAQNNFNIDSAANQLLYNIRSINTEQIILQTNKKIYSPKENIWFKAFEVDSATGRLVNTSKLLFVNLVNENDKVIHSLTLNMATAQQEGAFLSDSSLSGFYWIRAYTKNILNQNISNIGVQAIYILNGNGKPANYHLNNNKTMAASSDKSPSLTLYPEGGSLISGATSLVAVKLTDDKGKALSDSVLVKDNRNDITAKFLTNANGLGKFVFEPSIYKRYAVFILRNNHYDSVTSLPAINPFSAQIAVEQQTEQYIKTRVLLEDSIYKKDYETFLIGLHKDSICAAAKGTGNYEFNIPLSNFPKGIANLLLYSADGKLISERNIYINKNDSYIAVNTDKNNYAAREKVDMTITVTDSKNNPVSAALSVSVNDSRVNDSVNSFSVDTLENLSQDDADLIMLTQQNQNTAYWQNLYNLKKDNPVTYNDDNLHISGVVLNKKNEPAANKPVLLISNNTGIILQDTTDLMGKFMFQPPGFNTGMPFSMQINYAHDPQDSYHVILDSGFHFDFKTPAALKETFSPEEIQNIKKTESFYINSLLIGEDWLPEVIVKSSPYPKETNIFPETVISKEKLHSGSVHNAGDAVLEFSKLHVIGGYLMAGGPNGFKPGPTDEPEIIMDGAVMGQIGKDLDFLKTISTSGIDHIRILTGASAAGYGLIAGTGVIEIYSANSSTYSNNLAGGLTTIYPKGFDSVPDFQMPDYTDKRAKNSKIDDTRTSIYWNGDILTDGKTDISFFTGDTPATYIVTISGVTANGNKVYKTFTISRK